MSPFALLSSRARSYVIAIAVLGGAVLAASIAELISAPIDVRWFVLVLLTVLTSSVTVKVPSVAATLSISEAFVFSAIILFGWPAGTVLASLDGLVISLWLHRRRAQPVYRLIFNATAPALSTFLAYWVYAALGAPSVSSPDFHITQILIPLCGFAAAYFLANSGLIAAAIALEQHQSAIQVWRQNFVWLSINYFSGASMASLLVAFGGRDGANALGAIWIVLPLLAITYFTYKSSMARIEDANKHLEQLNTLYLSTIETLAMAIDAKDQITHGHIRRVQAFAVALAKEVGITDQQQIKAIEAAALLHDMGKLAVPEYILNKPGPLTPAEFERMKLHAAAGADILSAIDFPYPVVPIVRHHHENWDGNGYPTGLKGADIPIGARVLSVVDCFDALTSDRPYRPRLTDEEALQVVLDRRGTMYDPLIVDSFVSLYARLKRERPAEHVAMGTKAVGFANTPDRLAAISASAGESRAMYRLTQRLAAQHSLDGALADAAEEIAALIPATAVAIYRPSEDASELEAAHVYGGHVDWLRGRRVRFGEKIVGWSASSGRSVLNADPSGEFGQLAHAGPSPLRSCLTVPIVIGADRLGVIAAFSAIDGGFTVEDQRIVEAVVRHITPVLERLKPGRERQPKSATDIDTFQLTPQGMIACRCTAKTPAGTDAVGIALAVIRRHLGTHAVTQIVNGNDIYIGIGTEGIESIGSSADRLRGTLAGSGLVDSGQRVVMAVTPKDGTNLEHLLYTCRQRLGREADPASLVH